MPASKPQDDTVPLIIGVSICVLVVFVIVQAIRQTIVDIGSLELDWRVILFWVVSVTVIGSVILLGRFLTRKK